MRFGSFAAIALLLCCTGPALAQGRGGLILYNDIGYQGARLPVDRDVNDFQGTGFNDSVSSIQVQSGVWEVCEDANFRGRCLTISRDTPTLVPLGFNDRISSVRMVSGGGSAGGDSRGDNRNGFGSAGSCNGFSGGSSGFGRDNGPRGAMDNSGNGVRIFADDGYRGDSRPVSGDIRNLKDLGFNDVASSVQIGAGQWQFCEDADFRGRCVTLNRDTPSLRDYDFNDKISSIRRVR